MSLSTQLLFQESELSNFLSAAQALEVKGLCDKNHSKLRPTQSPVVPAVDPTPYMHSRTIIQTVLYQNQDTAGKSQQNNTSRAVKNEIAMTVEHNAVLQVDVDVPDYEAEMVYSDSAVVAGYEEGDGNVSFSLNRRG